MTRLFFFLYRGSLAVLTLIFMLSSVRLYAESTTNDPWASYEKQLFLQSFETDPLPSRLARLEVRVFGNVHTNESTHQRETHLLSVLGKAAPFQNAASQQPKPIMMARRPQQEATDYPTITSLERSGLKTTFEKDDISDRLTRLEQQMFGQASPQMPLADRMDRLLQHHPIESNTSLSQPINPALASQGLASPGYSPSAPPMVQIGAGYSENNRWGFSNELLQMLPPQMRAQMNARTQPTSVPPRVAPPLEYHLPPPAVAPFGSAPVLGVPLSP